MKVNERIELQFLQTQALIEQKNESSRKKIEPSSEINLLHESKALRPLITDYSLEKGSVLVTDNSQLVTVFF